MLYIYIISTCDENESRERDRGKKPGFHSFVLP